MKYLVILYFSIVLVSCAHNPTVSWKDLGVRQITILHSNDTHGGAWAESDEYGQLIGGFAAQSAQVNQIRSNLESRGGTVLLLSAGDINTGTPESDLLSAQPDIMAMNDIGYDAMTVGNHEFDKGLKHLLDQERKINFPLLSANLRYKETGKRIFRPYTIVKRNGVRFGILGLTTPALKKLVLAKHTQKVKVTDPITEARKVLPELKANSDILIALTHVGISDTDEFNDNTIAEKLPEFRVIVGGHSHTELAGGATSNQSVIVQAGHGNEYLGRVDILWHQTTNKFLKLRAALIPLYESKGVDAPLKAKLEEARAQASKMLDKKIGTAKVELIGGKEARHSETNLGNLITDIIRKETKTEICLFNGGGIRATIPAGPVKVRDIYSVFPFSNTVVTAKIRGSHLKKALQSGIEHQHLTGSFPHVSGLKLIVEGKSLIDVRFRGKRLRDDQVLTISTNNFLIAGGDYYDALKHSAELHDTGQPVERFLIDWFKIHQSVAPKKEGRITQHNKVYPQQQL